MSEAGPGEVMRISSGFFRRLLHQTEPREALEGLAATWAPRIRKGHPTLGLSAAEHTVHVVTAYVEAVTSGGHPAFFFAFPAETGMTARVAEGLAALGLRVIARAFGEACCLWPGQAIATFDNAAELDRAMQDRSSAGFPGRATEVLDQAVWRSNDVEPALLAFLRAHEDELLRPERGLEPSIATTS